MVTLSNPKDRRFGTSYNLGCETPAIACPGLFERNHQFRGSWHLRGTQTFLYVGLYSPDFMQEEDTYVHSHVKAAIHSLVVNENGSQIAVAFGDKVGILDLGERYPASRNCYLRAT